MARRNREESNFFEWQYGHFPQLEIDNLKRLKTDPPTASGKIRLFGFT